MVNTFCFMDTKLDIFDHPLPTLAYYNYLEGEERELYDW